MIISEINNICPKNLKFFGQIIIFPHSFMPTRNLNPTFTI